MAANKPVSATLQTLVAGTAYRERTREDAKLALHDELIKLAAKCPADQREHFKKEMSAFEHLFSRYIEEAANTTIDWDKIKPPPAEVLRPYKSLGQVDLAPKDLLNKLVVVKLNGGLGTLEPFFFRNPPLYLCLFAVLFGLCSLLCVAVVF